MKLIVGLGNIGKEYANTRHNVGFLAVDAIARFFELDFSKEKFQGIYTEFFYEGEKIILLKPAKYMNLSGEVVKSFATFFKIDISDILIISDDLDMPVGKIKLKYKGSSGGHNGLKNIEYHMKTNQYKRLKIGISNNKEIDTKDYVLGKISSEEMHILEEVFNQMPNIFKDFIKLDFEKLMSKYNKK
jgi:PTH1 family peptidyl-tRNA hydrolase